MSARSGEDPLTPAEARLVALLVVLRSDAPRPGEPLRAAVMRAVRWQHLVRGVVVELSDLLAGVGDAVLRLSGLRGRPRDGGTA